MDQKVLVAALKCVIADFAKEYDENDLQDAIEYFSTTTEETVERVRFHGYREMKPEDFIDDTSHFNNTEYGWLKDIPEDQWIEQLEDEYNRDFPHIVENYNKGTLSPGIQINGEMGDGRGRALFSHALGIPMSVAIFESY